MAIISSARISAIMPTTFLCFINFKQENPQGRIGRIHRKRAPSHGPQMGAAGTGAEAGAGQGHVRLLSRGLRCGYQALTLLRVCPVPAEV